MIKIQRFIVISLSVIFILSSIIYIYDWINSNVDNYFPETINLFYSKIFLIALILSFRFTNKYTYFLCLILLQLNLIYILSGILFCCETPFDYTFEIYSFFIDHFDSKTSVYIRNFIFGIPDQGNLILTIYLLIPGVWRIYFRKKDTIKT